MNTFLSIIGIAVISVFAVIIDGFVLSILWKWFIVSTFGVALLSIPQALGLSLFVKHVTSHDSTATEKGEDNINKIVRAITTPLFVLAIGWLIHKFI